MKTRIHLAAPLLALSLATATAAWAHTDVKPPEQLGRDSCTPAAQATLERAVALLHSFWFREGEKTFREVLEPDPNCAIATWGNATILIGNPFAAGPTPAQSQQAMRQSSAGGSLARRPNASASSSRRWRNTTSASPTARTAHA
jgi:hypothetical protein